MVETMTLEEAWAEYEAAAGECAGAIANNASEFGTADDGREERAWKALGAKVKQLVKAMARLAAASCDGCEHCVALEVCGTGTLCTESVGEAIAARIDALGGAND